MQPYADHNGTSGIAGYQSADTQIIVQFKKGTYIFYKYTYASASSGAIETMKSLARQGSGLNSYISTNDPGFSSKSRTLAGL